MTYTHYYVVIREIKTKELVIILRMAAKRGRIPCEETKDIINRESMKFLKLWLNGRRADETAYQLHYGNDDFPDETVFMWQEARAFDICPTYELWEE